MPKTKFRVSIFGLSHRLCRGSEVMVGPEDQLQNFFKGHICWGGVKWNTFWPWLIQNQNLPYLWPALINIYSFQSNNQKSAWVKSLVLGSTGCNFELFNLHTIIWFVSYTFYIYNLGKSWFKSIIWSPTICIYNLNLRYTLWAICLLPMQLSLKFSFQ